ncbi:MAG: hypothetical protein JSS29_10945 [Proteobacteria bacterium]|nr:hypothetical protein [Pseudomonadota bacterium]
MPHIAHLPGILGVVSGLAGSLMLIWFPADARGYLKKGTWETRGGYTYIGTDETDRQYRYFKSGFYAALVLVLVGSLLALFDFFLY